MEYIKKYDLIVTAMCDFEESGCQFYLSLLSYNCIQGIQDNVKQLIFEKGRRLDTFSGMAAISSFLLEDSCNEADYECQDLSDWLGDGKLRSYGSLDASRIARCHCPRQALKIIIELEQQTLEFYKSVLRRITMNTVEIDSMICQQKRCLEKMRYRMEQMPVDGAVSKSARPHFRVEPVCSIR